MTFETERGRRGSAVPLLLIALGLLTGCGEDANPPGTDPPAAANPPATTPGAPESPPLAGTEAPPVPYVERGGCPFECCVYGQWETVTDAPVFAAEGDTSTVAFILPAGQRFTAETGNVHVIQPGLAVATDTITLASGSPGGTATRLEAGDTVHVLGHQGEGVYEFWRNGATFSGEAFWAMMPLSGRPAAGRLISEPITEWWVRVAESGGGNGWIRMGRAGQGIRGNDACA